MPQHQQYLLGKLVIVGVTRIRRSVRTLFSEKVIFEWVRVLVLASLCALLGSVITMHVAPKAFAVQAKPPTGNLLQMRSVTGQQLAFNLISHQFQ